ncbi:MAG TPA: hypothetical protein VGQ83_27940, partial [Polyangia bacterium]
MGFAAGGGQVEAQRPALGAAQVAAEALAREERAGALRVRLALGRRLEARELRREELEQLRPVLPLPGRLVGVEAHDVAA